MGSPNDMDASHLANSLYKHLVDFVSKNQEYRPLLASWELEQTQYTNLLGNIVHSFPTYTRHDHLHSARVVANIEMILGDERIKCLEPTDTWLLLQCAYSHDTGMVITKKQIDEIIKSGELQQHINELRDKDGEYAKAAHAFEIDRLEKQLCHTSKWTEPIETQRSVMLVLTSFFRSRHGKYSKDRIESELEERTYNGIFPSRIRRLVGDINYVHTADLAGLMELVIETNGFSRDCAHPRFVASLLRLGDLLDVDNNRLNPYQISIEQQPSDAKSHVCKHQALEHILISPKRIELDFDFKIDDPLILRNACKLARECYTSLYKELEHLALHWQDIAPLKFPGSAPSLKETSIRLDGYKLSSEDIELRYEISHVRACEIIQGVGLYDEPLTFIRELIQNAMDATKIRVFEDLCGGVYGHLPDHCEKRDLNPQDIKPLLNPHIDNLGIRVEIELQIDSSENHLQPQKQPPMAIIHVKDSGMGISRKKLYKMKHIGNIFDPEYERNVSKMPQWMKPTGSFGIGLQSVFQYADIFEMNTFSREENKLLNIQFYSTKLGGEIICLPDKNSERQILPGTEVTVCIDNDKLTWDEFTRQIREENKSDIFSKGNDIRFIYIRQYLESHLKEDIFPVYIDFYEREAHSKKKQYYNKQSAPFVKSIFSESWTDAPGDQERPQDDLFTVDWDSLSFVYWSEENSIAARCTLLFTEPKDEEINNEINISDLPLLGETRISYRGMQVKNVKHSEQLRLPLCDVDAYIMLDEAKKFLRTSRDGLLDEIAQEIKEKISSTVFNGISNMLLCYGKNCQRFNDESKTNEPDLQYEAWIRAHEKLSGKQAFIMALGCKERINKYERSPMECSGDLIIYKNLLIALTDKLKAIAIPAWVVANNANMEYPQYYAADLFSEKQKHWFGQSIYHGKRVELDHVGAGEENPIVYTPDFYSKLTTKFYWHDVFFIQQKDEMPVPIYTYDNIPHDHMNLSDTDIEMLFNKAYSELSKEDNNLNMFFGDRPYFPAIPGFEALCVNEEGININHIKNCGTYIIAPFNSAIAKMHLQLDKLKNAANIDEASKNILLDPSFNDLVQHIIDHSVCKQQKSKKVIEHDYKRFIKYFIDVLNKQEHPPKHPNP